MGKGRWLALAFAFLSAAAASAYNEILGFTSDGSRYAVRTSLYEAIDGTGGDPDHWVDVFSTANREHVERIWFSRQVIDGEENSEARFAANKELTRQGNARVRELLLRPGVDLPGDLEIGTLTTTPDGAPVDTTLGMWEPSPEGLVVTFTLVHKPSGAGIELDKVNVYMPVFIDSVSGEPGGRAYIVVWHSPPPVEFGPSSADYFVIGPKDLALFRNAVGFHYYGRKDYERALGQFRAATDLDPVLEKAAYNAACMQALLGRVDAAIEALRTLKAIGTPEALRLHGRVGVDADFDRIRSDARLKAYLEG